MLLAVITLRQIIEIIVVFTIVNGVILAPLVVAILGAFGERAENEPYRPRH